MANVWVLNSTQAANVLWIANSYLTATQTARDLAQDYLEEVESLRNDTESLRDEVESFTSAARNNYAFGVGPIDGAFATTSTATLFGAAVEVPFDMPLREIVLRCQNAPIGAPWTVEFYRTTTLGVTTLIATVSVTSGQTVGRNNALNVQLLEFEIITAKCTSVGTTDTGSFGRALFKGWTNA